MGAVTPSPFLEIPPFPGARVLAFEVTPSKVEPPSRTALVDALRRNRVGGHYWRSTDDRPEGIVVRSSRLWDSATALSASLDVPLEWRPALPAAGDVDLWSLLERCRALVCEGDDPARYVAALLDIPAYVGSSEKADETAIADLEKAVGGHDYASPFDERPLGVIGAIELCGFWRELVESNRDLVGAMGFAFWKQAHVAPLLWDGGDPLAFWRSLPAKRPAGAVAVWRSKVDSKSLKQLEHDHVPLVEVEDGFLRSAGLGADCVPPLSITVDRRGPYFDPATASELELLLQDGHIGPSLTDRARRLRALIVERGLGKYERGTTELPRFGGQRVHILVPGQVEDDRSVLTGGAGLPNEELLRRVRAANPEAFVIYKPHPDVGAGHRRGAVGPAAGEALADMITTDLSIASLLDLADEVHVNTSLAGFEALMREKKVSTYGVPFYSGWGLTADFGKVPASRSRRRTLDELVAATLLLYPRYIDPSTGLPCPAEVVAHRLAEDEVPDPGLLVRVRRLQGSAYRMLDRLFG